MPASLIVLFWTGAVTTASTSCARAAAIALSRCSLSCFNSRSYGVSAKRSEAVAKTRTTAWRILIWVGDNFAKNIQSPLNLPLFVHHTTARLWGNIYDKSKTQKIGSRLDGYYACLDSRSIKDIFFYWFKTFEDSALKFNRDKSLYNAFTQAITSVVPEWNKIHFSWELHDLMGLTNTNHWLPLRNLSDGYRSIVHLTADIAYRAIKLNPHLGESAVLETEGIVMIDEIDMHLHPKWQRHIVEDLKRTFPAWKTTLGL